MRKFLLWSIVFSVFVAYSSWAQERTVSGKVSSAEDGSGLPGVNVVLKGTTTGTVTDIDGNYRVTVPAEGGVLQFSFIGLASQEVEIGSRSVIDVQMQSDVTELTEVVVTAQGIQKEKKALGYAVTSVAAKEIEQRPEADVGRVLRGKVPGVAINTQNGLSGSGTSIIIRGYSSISGSNQPLFVVDGVPFNTNTNAQGSFADGSLNSNSRFLDLDPNTIASIEVLKGLSATVLYGEQGKNGVILVTTKNGNAAAAKDFQVTFTQAVFANQVNAIPDYQDNWGNGFHNVAAANFFSNWGNRVDRVDSIPHPWGISVLGGDFPELQGANYAYRAYDDPSNFFRTGIVSTSNLNVTGREGNTGYNMSIGYTNESGVVDNNDLEKVNLGLGFNTQLSAKFSVNGSFNVALTDQNTPPLGASTGSNATGSSPSIFANVLYTPRTIDLFNQPFESPVTGQSAYYRRGNDIPNPRWLTEYTSQVNDTRRFYGRMVFNYKILDNLSVSYRGGLDTYSETQDYFINRGLASSWDPDPNVLLGVYRSSFITNTIWDHTVLFTYNQQLNQDLNLEVLVGGNVRRDDFQRQGVESQDQVVFDFIDHPNFITQSAINSFSGTDIAFQSREVWAGVYGTIQLDYRDFLFLNLQGRNDWTSTLESDNRATFYPSASLSFLPTTAIPGLQSDNLNFLKLRFGFGTSAANPDPYLTRNIFTSTSRAFVQGANVFSSNGVSNVLGNPNLDQETLSEIEVGVELKAIDNRVSLDFSYFNKRTQDLITERLVDNATGFEETTINIGELLNTGVEAALTVTPVRTNDMRLDLTGNFYTYEATIEELQSADEIITTAGFIGFIENAQLQGQPYNSIRTTVIQRNDDGIPVIDGAGNWVAAPDLQVTGDPNPDYTLTGIADFTWKDINFRMQWDYTKGGDIASITGAAITGRGLSTATDFDRDNTIILPGVSDADGSVNDIQITSTDAFFNNVGFGPTETRIFDGTTLRLQEISLGYNLPKSLIENTFIENVSLSLVGQNLWVRAFNFYEGTNFDPNVLGTGVGNGLGLDFLTGPSTRRFGGTVSVTF
jgi:TonB-linked SusC/RagA family outer membrane protein